jgi:hypothetical protein
MTKERIEVMREAVLPFVKKKLVEKNYEGLGESDAEEFENDFNELLNLSIKAIEQESCEDAVSRKAVLEIIEREEFKGDALSEIESLSPVTPTRKKGKWRKEYWGAMYDTCSECRQRVISGYFEFNYCPNCGAEMEGEE